MLRIKKNDTVLVLTGKDKGKRGTVIEIVPEKNLVRVEGVAILTKHAKARRQGEVSAIKKVEGFIDLSNVMLVVDSKPTRVGFAVTQDGKKVRVSKRTNEHI